jgi:heavy metal sensor kinase
MKLRAKVTLVTVGLMAVILAVGGIALYVQFSSGMLETVDAGLESRAEALAAQGDLADSGTPILTEPDDAFTQILDGEGKVVASSEGLTGERLLPRSALVGPLQTRSCNCTSAGYFTREVSTIEGPVESRLLVLAVNGPPVIIVGASLDDRNEALARLATLLLIGGPLALAFTGWVGWIVAGAALRPVERMRSEAAAISASDLTRRLPVVNHDDELGRLGDTLNEMLDRIETALERERRFVDDAAHELRTPLANLKAELELALKRERSTEALAGAVDSAREETDRLIRLAEDLLVLSRANDGRLPIRREETEVSELIESTVAAFVPRASAKGIAIDVSADPAIRASVDSIRIRQAVGNLLENSLRHTPRGGSVTVAAKGERNEDSEGIVIEVTDTGPGFEPSFLPHAFEPFSRSDAGRSRPTGGTGLGLAIVKAVVEAHGGTVEASNGPEGGAKVSLAFPSLISDSPSSHRPASMMAATRKEDP